MKFILRFTPSVAENYYFVRHGDTFGLAHQHRLIAETTAKRENARRFDTHEAALAALKLSDDPPGWLIDEVAE